MRITIAAAFLLSSSILSTFGTSQDDAFQKTAHDYIEQYLRRIRRMQRSSGTIGLTVN